MVAGVFAAEGDFGLESGGLGPKQIGQCVLAGLLLRGGDLFEPLQVFDMFSQQGDRSVLRVADSSSAAIKAFWASINELLSGALPERNASSAKRTSWRSVSSRSWTRASGLPRTSARSARARRGLAICCVRPLSPRRTTTPALVGRFRFGRRSREIALVVSGLRVKIAAYLGDALELPATSPSFLG